MLPMPDLVAGLGVSAGKAFLLRVVGGVLWRMRVVDGSWSTPERFAAGLSQLSGRLRRSWTRGAAVALGAPLLVRLFVPLWVVNATPLPSRGLGGPRAAAAREC